MAEPRVTRSLEAVVAEGAEPRVTRSFEAVVAEGAEPRVTRSFEAVVAEGAEPRVTRSFEAVVAEGADPRVTRSVLVVIASPYPNPIVEIDADLTGNSSLSANLSELIQASLAGGSSLSATPVLKVPIQASLAGGSSFVLRDTSAFPAYLLEPPRVGQANSPFTQTPDNYISNQLAFNTAYPPDE
jgi:hypothetical protein